MRIDIKNQNQIGQSCILFGRREKIKKQKETISDDNPTIIHRHTTYHME
jgi:hypothetical protein